MERTRCADIGSHVGEQVKLAGWAHNVRRLSRVSFLILRDASGLAQVVAVGDEAAQLDELLPESVVEVEGRVVAEAQAPGGFEIHGPAVTVLVPVSEALPTPINKPRLEAQLETYLNNAPLTLRHPLKQATFRLSSGCMAAFRGYLNGQGFVEIATPKIVASATESGANVFAIDYFGRPAYLAQSPQFYKQIMVGVFERVFEIGPVFRAEPHSTVRHINEYVSMDVEMGFIDDHHDVMAVAEGVIRAILDHAQAHCPRDLEALEVEIPLLPERFPQVFFPDAQRLILDRYGEDCRDEPDLSPQHERWLGEWAREEYGSDFLFVTGYPMSKRPFYTHRDPERPAYSNSFDLLFRGMELITGGQRLHRYPDYVAALAAQGVTDLRPFESYLIAFRYGMPPHGGFAIGLERLVMQLTGAANLRETTLFPRDMSRLTP